MRLTMLRQSTVLVVILAVSSTAVGQGCGTSETSGGTAVKEVPATQSCGSTGPLQATGSARLLSDTGIVELPLERVFDYIVVPVSVDGSEPLRLILDTTTQSADSSARST